MEMYCGGKLRWVCVFPAGGTAVFHGSSGLLPRTSAVTLGMVVLLFPPSY